MQHRQRRLLDDEGQPRANHFTAGSIFVGDYDAYISYEVASRCSRVLTIDMHSFQVK